MAESILSFSLLLSFSLCFFPFRPGTQAWRIDRLGSTFIQPCSAHRCIKTAAARRGRRKRRNSQTASLFIFEWRWKRKREWKRRKKSSATGKRKRKRKLSTPQRSVSESGV
jgi:hypothetical protein